MAIPDEATHEKRRAFARELVVLAQKHEIYGFNMNVDQDGYKSYQVEWRAYEVMRRKEGRVVISADYTDVVVLEKVGEKA